MDLIHLRFLTDDTSAVFKHHVKTCAHYYTTDLNDHGQANSNFCMLNNQALNATDLL